MFILQCQINLKGQINMGKTRKLKAQWAEPSNVGNQRYFWLSRANSYNKLY